MFICFQLSLSDVWDSCLFGKIILSERPIILSAFKTRLDSIIHLIDFLIGPHEPLPIVVMCQITQKLLDELV